MSIDEMPAGREMDAEVLVRVFGFPRKKIWPEDEGTTFARLMYIPSGKPRRTHAIDSRPVPRFSEDIGAAVAAAEALSVRHRCGWSVAYRYPIAIQPRYGARICGGDLSYSSPNLEEWGFGATPAEALCRVMLKALS